MELLALVAFLEDEADGLAGCLIWFYMGSNNSLSAVTRGDSNTAAIAYLVSRAWELIHRFQIKAWFRAFRQNRTRLISPHVGNGPPLPIFQAKSFPRASRPIPPMPWFFRARIPSAQLRVSRECGRLFKGVIRKR